MLFETNKEKKKNEEIIFERNREMIENRLKNVFEKLNKIILYFALLFCVSSKLWSQSNGYI